jgi:hypothetical protein
LKVTQRQLLAGQFLPDEHKRTYTGHAASPQSTVSVSVLLESVGWSSEEFGTSLESFGPPENREELPAS